MDHQHDGLVHCVESLSFFDLLDWLEVGLMPDGLASSLSGCEDAVSCEDAVGCEDTVGSGSLSEGGSSPSLAGAAEQVCVV